MQGAWGCRGRGCCSSVPWKFGLRLGPSCTELGSSVANQAVSLRRRRGIRPSAGPPALRPSWDRASGPACRWSIFLQSGCGAVSFRPPSECVLVLDAEFRSLSMRARAGDNREVVGSRLGQCRVLAVLAMDCSPPPPTHHPMLTRGEAGGAAIALAVGAVYGPRVEGAICGTAPPSSRLLMDDGRGRKAARAHGGR